MRDRSADSGEGGRESVRRCGVNRPRSTDWDALVERAHRAGSYAEVREDLAAVILDCVVPLARRWERRGVPWEDVAQEVAFTATEAVEARRVVPENVRGFLRLKVRDVAVDHIRGRERDRRAIERIGQVAPSQFEQRADPFDRAWREEARERLQAGLRHLPQPERVAIRLHYLRGMTHAEVARRLHRSRRTVIEWTRRGLLVLRSSLWGLW